MQTEVLTNHMRQVGDFGAWIRAGNNQSVVNTIWTGKSCRICRHSPPPRRLDPSRRGKWSEGAPAYTVKVVQSLNSPFFPPHIGAEPGRAKEESRITCMRMLRTPPFFPPNRGKTYLEVLSRFGLWLDFFWIIINKQECLHSDWLKTCQSQISGISPVPR